MMTSSQHVYEVRQRKDHRCVDLISIGQASRVAVEVRREVPQLRAGDFKEW
jgi:hypothetical protein